MARLGGYTSIQITGDFTDALRQKIGRTYGKVVDIEVYSVDQDDYAAVAFVAVECHGQGQENVEGIVYLLKHDPEGRESVYHLKDIHESAGPTATFCLQRNLDLLSPTDDELALSWRERCREELELNQAASGPFH